MAGKDIAVKKYVVRLSAEEREHLQALIRKGEEPSEAPVEGAHFVEGRCLGGRRRLERQPDYQVLGHQCIYDLPGAQATGGRGLGSGVEPQVAGDAAGRCDFRR